MSVYALRSLSLQLSSDSLIHSRNVNSGLAGRRLSTYLTLAPAFASLSLVLYASLYVFVCACALSSFHMRRAACLPTTVAEPVPVRGYDDVGEYVNPSCGASVCTPASFDVRLRLTPLCCNAAATVCVFGTGGGIRAGIGGSVLLVIAVEHILLFLKYWMESIIPRMPDRVRHMNAQ